MTPEYRDDTEKRGRGRPPKNGHSARNTAFRSASYRNRQKFRKEHEEVFFVFLSDMFQRLDLPLSGPSEDDYLSTLALQGARDRFNELMRFTDREHLERPADAPATPVQTDLEDFTK